MVTRHQLGRLYWIVATPVAVALDAVPIWGNLQSPGARWVWYLWAGAVALSVAGVVLFAQPWRTGRVRQAGIVLLLGALALLAPLAFFLYLGVAGAYHVVAGLLTFWVWRHRTHGRFPLVTWGCLVAMVVLLLVVPRVPPTGGSAPFVAGLPYMWYVTALGIAALGWLSYTVVSAEPEVTPGSNDA